MVKLRHRTAAFCLILAANAAPAARAEINADALIKATAGTAKIKSLDYYAISKKCPATPAGYDEVKLTIKNSNPHNIKGTIKHTPATGSDITWNVGAKLGTITDSRLDFDARTYFPSKDYVKVTVKLNGNKIQLYPGSKAITAGNETSKYTICTNTTVIDPNHPSDSVSFFIMKWSTSGAPANPKELTMFNIALVAEDDDDSDFQTIVIIDPKIRNDG